MWLVYLVACLGVKPLIPDPPAWHPWVGWVVVEVAGEIVVEIVVELVVAVVEAAVAAAVGQAVVVEQVVAVVGKKNR